MGPLPRSCRPHSLPGQSRACERVRAVLPQHIRLKCADEGTVGMHTPLVRLRPTFLTFLALLTDLLPALRATAAGMMLLTTVLSSRLFFTLYIQRYSNETDRGAESLRPSRFCVRTIRPPSPDRASAGEEAGHHVRAPGSVPAAADTEHLVDAR